MRPIRFVSILSALAAVVVLAGAALAAPVTTAFTYQGRLQMNGAPYSGSADFVFRLHDDAAAGAQVGADVTLAGVSVLEGLFTVELDFGAVFDGTALWLETEVMTPGDGGPTLLAPRQSLTAAPYALYALNGAGGGGGGPWLNDTNGITYSGNVGLGAASRVDRKLWIDYGTGNGNPLWVRNNNASYAAFAIQNDAVNGYGLYDGWSDRHYVEGRLGLGTLTPSYRLDLNAVREPGARIVSSGSTLTPGTHAALYVSGLTSTGLFAAPSDGIYSTSTDGRAVSGWSTNHWGVSGDCTSAGTYGVLGTPNEGLYASSPNATKPAARLACPSNGIALDAGAGLVKVKTLQILGGADVAERFDVDGSPEPGTVLVIDGSTAGRLRTSDEAYSHRVAGVVSGANRLDAGVVLSEDGRTEGTAAVALTGRVWVKCDASDAPIAVGDLLTTAPRAGHAMKAADRERAMGAVLGKAMTSLDSGTGMVLVLVSLQ